MGALIVDEQESRSCYKEYQLARTVNDPEMHAAVLCDQLAAFAHQIAQKNHPA